METETNQETGTEISQGMAIEISQGSKALRQEAIKDPKNVNLLRKMGQQRTETDSFHF